MGTQDKLFQYIRIVSVANGWEVVVNEDLSRAYNGDKYVFESWSHLVEWLKKNLEDNSRFDTSPV